MSVISNSRLNILLLKFPHLFLLSVKRKMGMIFVIVFGKIRNKTDTAKMEYGDKSYMLLQSLLYAEKSTFQSHFRQNENGDKILTFDFVLKISRNGDKKLIIRHPYYASIKLSHYKIPRFQSFHSSITIFLDTVLLFIFIFQ